MSCRTLYPLSVASATRVTPRRSFLPSTLVIKRGVILFAKSVDINWLMLYHKRYNITKGLQLMSTISTTTEREQYELDLANRNFDQTASPDDLCRNNDLNRVGWCKVHAGVFYPGGHYDRVRLVKSGVCGYCDSWVDLWRRRDSKDTVRINGEHYAIGDGETVSLGMGGTSHTIRFDDGRLVTTKDLWHQGTIPAQFKNVMPDNAKFATRIAVEVA